MNAADLMAEIMQAGGEIWIEGDRLKFRAVSARLVPLLKEYKAGLLAELPKREHGECCEHGLRLIPPGENTPQSEDDVHREPCATAVERLAIQWESTQPREPDPAPVLGFDGMPDLTPAQHGAIQARLMNPAVGEHHKLMPPAPPAQAMAPQSAPATVRCRDCARWTPGQTTEGIGRCTASGNGLPPPGGSGYNAPYPNAPRRCPEYLGSAS